MGILLYLGTALVGIPGILLFPAFLPHFLTFVMNKRRIKGKVGEARVKFRWPVFVTLEVNEVRLTNPHGFEHENFVSVKLARASLNVWSLFTKSIKMGAIELEDVNVYVERQKGKGINVSAYIKQVKGKAPLELPEGTEEEEGVESEGESNLVLSLLGMVSERTDRVAENLSAAVEKEGGVGNFAKNTTASVLTGTFSKVSNLVGATSELLSSKAKSLESDVKQAGGIDKWAVNTTSTVATAVSDKTKEGISSVKERGIGGAATFVTDNTTSAVGAVASTANDTLLEEAIHRKVMGCYKEDVTNKYIDLVEVRVSRLHVDARKLMGANEDGNAEFSVRALIKQCVCVCVCVWVGVFVTVCV